MMPPDRAAMRLSGWAERPPLLPSSMTHVRSCEPRMRHASMRMSKPIPLISCLRQ